MVIKHLISCFSSDQPVLILHGKETDSWQCQLNQGAESHSLAKLCTHMTDRAAQTELSGSTLSPWAGLQGVPCSSPRAGQQHWASLWEGCPVQELLCLVHPAWRCLWALVSIKTATRREKRGHWHERGDSLLKGTEGTPCRPDPLVREACCPPGAWLKMEEKASSLYWYPLILIFQVCSNEVSGRPQSLGTTH